MRASILALQQLSARLSSTFSTPARVRTLAPLFFYPYLPLADRIAFYFYWLDVVFQ